jgi:hypothetical protein
VRRKLHFHPVKHVEEVFEIALEGWIRPSMRKKPRAAADKGGH